MGFKAVRGLRRVCLIPSLVIPCNPREAKRFCLNVSTTPIRQWGFRQCLPFSWTTLRGKHCQYLIAIMGVVDTFEHWLLSAAFWKNMTAALSHMTCYNLKSNSFSISNWVSFALSSVQVRRGLRTMCLIPSLIIPCNLREAWASLSQEALVRTRAPHTAHHCTLTYWPNPWFISHYTRWRYTQKWRLEYGKVKVSNE